MSNILLATLNARYAHASFGLRYLLANLGPLREQAELLEFEISQHTVDILSAIVSKRPRILGLGVYIWNVDQTTRLVADLKQVLPDLCIILGGPEVSYETAGQPIVDLADYVITGEADLTFAAVCSQILDGNPPAEKIIAAELPTLDRVAMPYELYGDEDLAHRVLYVEASRGCPFTCEFCLSALEIPVRQFPLDAFLESMQRLLDRGATQFKFVDRTFNLNLRVSSAILEFFLERMRPGLFLHFEMIPDRLPESLRELISRFPQGALQFEVGIQTFNPDVCERISRRQDASLVEQNLKFLHEQTGVHVHADLIVGLPGESLESFADGFDRLVAMSPQEIQVGLLKRLRGTPIVRHDDAWKMVYSPHSPYEILQNSTLDFSEIARMRVFARFWDLVANSGNFLESTLLLWGTDSPFWGFAEFADWLFAAEGRKHGVALKRLVEQMFLFLTDQRGLPPQEVATTLLRDYQRGGRSDVPPCLRTALAISSTSFAPVERVANSGETVRLGPPRQARHTRD